MTTHYKKGDEKLLLHFLQNAKDQHDLHDVKYSVMDVLEKNPEVHAKDCLQYIYNNITCSLCRVGIVNMLIEKEQLNKQLQNEIKYDCNKEIRALYNKHFT